MIVEAPQGDGRVLMRCVRTAARFREGRELHLQTSLPRNL
jgi:hypothetical protein